MAGLTDIEKVRIRHHLGFLNVTESSTFVLGTPASVETQFIMEGAWDKLLPEALPMVRMYLERCDKTEEQMFCGQESMETNRMGDLELNNQGLDNHQRQLLRSYRRWTNSLANLFGIYPNPFDKRTPAGGGINGRVVN